MNKSAALLLYSSTLLSICNFTACERKADTSLHKIKHIAQGVTDSAVYRKTDNNSNDLDNGTQGIYNPYVIEGLTIVTDTSGQQHVWYGGTNILTPEPGK